MSDQPEALRLADALDYGVYDAEMARNMDRAAAELRRLHGEVERLRAALGAMVDTSRKHVTDMNDEEAAAFWAAWKVLDEVALKEPK
jgi:HAMP domain-containing protein